MTPADVLVVLRGEECRHRSALCAQCIAEASRHVETWAARAELVRDLDDAAIEFARRGAARFSARIAELEAAPECGCRNGGALAAARAATERATRDCVAAQEDAARWCERVKTLEAAIADVRARVA